MFDETYLFYYFHISDTPGNLELIVINTKTDQRVPRYCLQIPPKNVIKYFEDASNFNENFVKAVIFNVHEYENELFFTSNSEFLRFIIQIFKKKKSIPFRFIKKENFNLTMLFKAAKITPKIDKNIMAILVGEKEIYVEEVYQTPKGYIRFAVKNLQRIECPNGCNFEKIKSEIFAHQSQNSRKIIITALQIYSKDLWKNMCEIFQNQGAIFIDNISTDYQDEAIIEISLHLMNQKDNEFHIIPRFSYIVRNIHHKFLYSIKCDLTDGLPFTQTNLEERYYDDEYCIERYYEDQQKSEIIQIYPPLKSKYHKVKLTLNVDANMIPSLIQEPYIDPKIEKLPLILAKKIGPSKIPIIGFFDNSSIICLWNEKAKCYKFSEIWYTFFYQVIFFYSNPIFAGLYGKDLYISFDEEKPKYRNQAFDVLKKKPTFVVFDILMNLAAKFDNLYIHPSWPFVLTKNDKNLILYEFDNFDGNRKSATPEFLMALLLKDHLKVITEETDTKPKEIGIVIFDKFENTDFWDISLLPEKFKGSCSLLQIGCKIISVDD